MKTKIIHLTNSNVKSNYLLSIGRLYDNEKYDLSIGSFDPVGELHTDLEQIGIPTFSFHIKDQRLGFFAIPKIYKYLKKNKIDILHVHTFWVSLFGLIAGRIAGVKVVMTGHHADCHIVTNKKIHSLIDKFTAKHVDKVIAVSHFTRDILITKENVPSPKIEVVYNGLEKLIPSSSFNRHTLFKTLGVRPTDKVFLSIARVHPEKNLETIISALGVIGREDIHLLIAGGINDKNYLNKLKRKVSKEFHETNVHFLGFRSDILELLNASSLLIHSSLTESFGLAVAEAMQQRIPIIVSDLPALREVASDKVAYFFAPGNQFDLSDQIQKFLMLENSQELKERLAIGYNRFQDKFSFEKMMTGYEMVYTDLQIKNPNAKKKSKYSD